MLNQQLSTAQLIPLVLEIAPAANRAAITQQKPSRFEYAFGGKTVLVLYAPDGDKVPAKIAIPGYDEDAIPEAPAAPAAPAAAPRATAAAGAEPEINALLRKMFSMSASDLHMTSNHKPLIRLHGDMQELSDQPVTTPERMQALIGAIMLPHNADQFADTHDTDFAHEIAGLARFRVNVFLDRYGMGAVFRQIPMEIDYAVGQNNVLFRNVSTGSMPDEVKFAHVTAEAGVGSKAWAWSSAAFDFDGDGWDDLYVSNGRYPAGEKNLLFPNRGDGTFEEVTDKAGVGD